MAPPEPETQQHDLRRVLRLPDLVAMQVLLVFGATWVGAAGRAGSGHVVLWLAAIILFFVPIGLVVGFCANIWPEEGGVYQWTKHMLGPFAGFTAAWNFGMWAVLLIAGLGMQIAATLRYALGTDGAWMETSRWFVTALSSLLLVLLFLINLVGFRYGKWVAHFGTAVTLLVVGVAASLLFVHPGATPVHPHVSPQPAFGLAMAGSLLVSVNLFSKLSFYGLSGLEQVAVFAGEMRDPRRNIIRSAILAAPLIGLLYIITTGALLTYTKAAEIDLTGPIPQLLGTTLGAGSRVAALVGTVVNLAFGMFLIAQYATILAETSRLPMVAAWDHLFPQAFTRLHRRFGTPVLALCTVCGLAFLTNLFAMWGAGDAEAFQIISCAANDCYALYYVAMFLVPLVAGTRLARWPGPRPGWPLKLAALSGLGVTLLSFAFNLTPIVSVDSVAVFAGKILVLFLFVNAAGAAIYFRGSRSKSAVT